MVALIIATIFWRPQDEPTAPVEPPISPQTSEATTPTMPWDDRIDEELQELSDGVETLIKETAP